MRLHTRSRDKKTQSTHIVRTAYAHQRQKYTVNTYCPHCIRTAETIKTVATYRPILIAFYVFVDVINLHLLENGSTLTFADFDLN